MAIRRFFGAISNPIFTTFRLWKSLEVSNFFLSAHDTPDIFSLNT